MGGKNQHNLERGKNKPPQSCAPRRWDMLKQQLSNLSPEAFREKLQGGGLLLDVRRPEEFAQGHLPGAINIDYLSFDLWEQLRALPRDKPILVYCQTERRALRVCMLLQNGGFPEVHNLNLGLNAWLKTFGRLAGS